MSSAAKTVLPAPMIVTTVMTHFPPVNVKSSDDPPLRARKKISTGSTNSTDAAITRLSWASCWVEYH